MQEERYNIPRDLLFEIFVRLPIKSLCRLRCIISTEWNSVISDPLFADTQFDRSAPTPTLLIAIFDGFAPRCTTFYSSPYLPDQRNNQAVIHKAPYTAIGPTFNFDIQSVGGLVCIWFKWFNIRLEIYNPTTREPLYQINICINSEDRFHCIGCFFGYDPIGCVHKVLLAVDGQDKTRNSFRILTLDGQRQWRNVSREAPRYLNTRSGNVCIGGVVYYLASNGAGKVWLVGFDVRSETLQMVELLVMFKKCSHLVRLVEISGQATITLLNCWNNIILSVHTGLGAWFFRDIKLPSNWKRITFEREVVLEGTTPTGEFIFRHARPSTSFWLFYYNPQTGQARRREIPQVSECIMSSNRDGRCAVLAMSTSHRESVKSRK